MLDLAPSSLKGGGNVLVFEGRKKKKVVVLATHAYARA